MRIAEIQRFCMHDGPGIRTTVFVKGCPLRCRWCHNPETQSATLQLLYYANKCIGCGACATCARSVHLFNGQHTVVRERCVGCGECAHNCPTDALECVGKDLSIEEIFEHIHRDRAFYGEHGGVTVSGGEPFLQAEQLERLLRLCKDNGIHTAIETCGYFPPSKLKSTVPLCDLFLWDVKDTCPERHRQYTGVSNEPILQNLITADAMGAKTRVRCILINGINTTPQHYDAVAKTVQRLHHCEGVEWIPYHTFGSAKSLALDDESMAQENWIPSKEQIKTATAFLESRGVPVLSK